MNLSQELPIERDRENSESELIFALDIGTRSVIGIVGFREDAMFRVEAVEVMEHTKRAMIDGQIEDIEQVALVADTVKRRLEERTGLALSSVCVAAAGRALRTQKASCEVELDGRETLTAGHIYELEMAAIEEARGAIQPQGDADEVPLYCVGHSVIRYFLDDYAISTMQGHRGHKARVDIIATFLPSEVVESLYAAMAKINLMVASITLEPIAAMNAIIPQELRMLNLALVDIGAGTSDIAISSDGSVTAYTMATVAGDEITETIIHAFLVDFETAERMKLELGKNVSSIDYKDILGFSYSIDPRELMEKIRPAIDNLCGVICKAILEVNEKAPAAVFLVGGGSRIPTLCETVARGLCIEENKVAVGGNNYMKRMISAVEEVGGPEYATPVGIAITAMNAQSRDRFAVLVNGKSMQVFKSGAMTVMDILLMSGYQHNQIIGRAGKSVTIEWNRRKKVFRGSYPASAEILVNGHPASISTPIQTGDAVEIIPAVAGDDAAPVVRDLVEQWSEAEVALNGITVPIGTRALINGIPAAQNQQIHDLDIVRSYQVETLFELCCEAKLDLGVFRFLVNGIEQSGGYQLCAGDDIRYFSASLPYQPPIVETDSAESDEPAGASENAETALLAALEAELASPPAAEIPQPEPQAEPERPMRVRLNGRSVELYAKADASPYLFLDMLNFVDIDPSRPQGDIILKINGRNASYLDIVSEGSDIEIRWDNA